MGIVHISAPAGMLRHEFEVGASPAAVGMNPVPRLATREAFESPSGDVFGGILPDDIVDCGKD